jgi:hypothetical protein
MSLIYSVWRFHPILNVGFDSRILNKYGHTYKIYFVTYQKFFFSSFLHDYANVSFFYSFIFCFYSDLFKILCRLVHISCLVPSLSGSLLFSRLKLEENFCVWSYLLISFYYFSVSLSHVSPLHDFLVID